MFGDLMGKMKEAQAEVEKVKQRLDSITVQGDAYNGKVKIVATGNKKIVDVKISKELLSNKEELEDYLVIAINNALKSAENVHDSEMQSVAKGILPKIPGLF
ncbi:MAG: nucleoid-associated protein, YbaB/EbfC family [Bacteroidetes bacterium GWA2_30_7]|nr:MAG: nucleoid-associated protein, YbaB/EbfC family [Bacteroidetes bacterium GWA2_30_7]